MINIYPDIECPSCGETSFKHIDTLTQPGKTDVLEYRCSRCNEYQTFADPARAMLREDWG